MARSRKPDQREPDRSAADYYKLNVRAVEDLVTADESNSPPVSAKELRKYRGKRDIHLADWLKAVLIKSWFAGVVCYFILWGLGAFLPSQLDQLTVTAVALGLVTDLLQNPLLRFSASPAGANDRWMFWPRKGFISLPVHILYAALLVFCVVKTYESINLGLTALGAADTLLGVGPILFGLFTAGWDLLFIALKKMLLRIVQDARRQVGPPPKGGSHA